MNDRETIAIVTFGANIIGSFAFSMWQQNYFAGLFLFCFLLTVDGILVGLKRDNK
jgi:hypothetical protein